MPGPKNNNNPELDYERIRLLFDNVRFGYIGMATSVCFLYLVAARYSTVEAARLWVAAMLVSYLPRIAVSLRFARRMRRRQITPENVGPWENYLGLSSVAPYLCFVAVIFLPYGDDAVVGTLLCAFAFMTMVAGGVLALSTSLASILLFMNLAMLSIIARFISLGDPAFVALAALVFLAYLQLSNLVFRQNRTLIENIALNIANSRSALIDPLTQLWNRRRLDLHIEKLLPTSMRSGQPFSLIMLDIDHFKQFNDTHGHGAGDQLLVDIAGILRECSREEDLAVRYGGEEFILVLPETDSEGAARIAERIRSAVRQQNKVTISAGIGEFAGDGNFERLLSRTDRALYEAKKSGRDRYVLATA